MHVLMISDLETMGGAAVAASRLAEGLCAMGCRVTRVVGSPDGNAHPWQTVDLSPRLAGPRWLWRSLPASLRRGLGRHRTAARLKSLIEELRPDAINIHNLHNSAKHGWTPEIAELCASLAPTVWTLHDMWSFTGRCAYAYDCRKFITGCDASCPTPQESPAMAPSRIAAAWGQRQSLSAPELRLTAVAPSRWLAGEARLGFWRDHSVHVIPNGLPLDVYRPVEQTEARTALGIKPDGLVLLAAAQDLRERRKGGEILSQALSSVKRRPLTLLTLGRAGRPFMSPGLIYHPLGYVEDEAKKVLAYSAADLFVHPAPVDNLPNVVLESLACGTPVAALPIGGVPEMVRAGQTGWLAERFSPEALACAIDQALNEIERGINLRPSCREVAHREYGLDLQAGAYLKLFQQLGKPSA